MDDDSGMSLSFPNNRAVSHPSYKSVATMRDYTFLDGIELVPDNEFVIDVEEPVIASDDSDVEKIVKQEIEKFGIDGLIVFKPLEDNEEFEKARGDNELCKLMYAQCTDTQQRMVADIVGVPKGNPVEPYFVVEVKGLCLKDMETIHADVHKDLLGILQKEYDWKLDHRRYNSEQKLAAAVVQLERHARMVYNRILPLRYNIEREVAGFVCFMDTSGETTHIYLYLRFIFKADDKDVYVTPIRNWAGVRDKMKSLTDNNKPALPQKWKANGFGKDSCAFIASPKKDCVYKVMRRTVTLAAYKRSDDIKGVLCIESRKSGSSRRIEYAIHLFIIIGVAILYHYWRGQFVSLLEWSLFIIIGVPTLYHYWRGHFVSLLVEDAIQRIEGREDELVTVYDIMNEYFDDNLIESLFHREPESIKSMKPILSTRFHDRWRDISGLVIYELPFHVSLGYKLRSLDEGMKLETAITVDSALPALADICVSYLLAGMHYPKVDVRPANLRLVGEVFRFMDWGETWGSVLSDDYIDTKDSELNLILRSEMRSTSFKNNLLGNYKMLQINGGMSIVDQLMKEMKSECKSGVIESIKDEIVKLGKDLIVEIGKIIDVIDIDEYFKV